MFYRILGWVIGCPLFLIGKITNNYAVAALVFILVVRLLYLIYSYFSENVRNRAIIATMYIKTLRAKYAGKEPQKYEEKALAVYNATKTSPITKVVLTVVLFFMLATMFVVFKNPLTYFYGSKNKEALIETAQTIEEYKDGVNEMDVVLAIKEYPEVFKDYNVSKIAESNIHLFGINILKPASKGNLTLLIPFMLIALMMYGAIKGLVIKLKKKQFTVKNLVPVAFIFLISSLLGLSAFVLPVSYYISLIISNLVSKISNPIIHKATIKIYSNEYKNINDKCEKIIEADNFTEQKI